MAFNGHSGQEAMMLLRYILERYPLRHPLFLDIFKVVFSNYFLTNNKLYKFYTLRKARQYASERQSAIMGVCLESTLECNAKCIMCYHGGMRLSGTMDMSLFKKIVYDCRDNNITTIGLSVYGEPLMDEYLFERIAYLRKHNLSYSFFTNGSLLDIQKANRLFELGGLTKINFSVCGYDPQVYESIMVGLRRDRVYNNILDFLKLKEKLSQGKPIVSISNVKVNLNKKDMRSFIKFWQNQKGVDHIITADLWDRIGSKNINEVGNLGKMHKGSGWLAPCREPWGHIYIFFDGKVAPCCCDTDLRRLIIGDMNRHTLRQIYSGVELNNLRKLHLDNRRFQHKICGSCTRNYIWF